MCHLSSPALRSLRHHYELSPNHPCKVIREPFDIPPLSTFFTPPEIFHYDISKFYPSIPHSLAIEAFQHYHPTKLDELEILKAVLSFNYLVSGDLYYHLGSTGIPMGLPLAPEIARVVTAYQIDTRLAIHPPVALSLYFDNLYTTHNPEMMLDVFLPFTLLPEEHNTLQDAGYHAQLREFCPNPFQILTPIPIHPLSYHPHRRMVAKSYHSTVHRLSAFCSDPNLALYSSLSRFLGNLRLSGRDPADIIAEIALLCYFPIKTEKLHPPDVSGVASTRLVVVRRWCMGSSRWCTGLSHSALPSPNFSNNPWSMYNYFNNSS